MQLEKRTEEYLIYKKRSGRYGVKGSNGKWINGDDKAGILAKEGLIKITVPTKKEEPAEEVAEAPAEETATEEAPAEESTSEEA